MYGNQCIRLPRIEQLDVLTRIKTYPRYNQGGSAAIRQIPLGRRVTRRIKSKGEGGPGKTREGNKCAKCGQFSHNAQRYWMPATELVNEQQLKLKKMNPAMLRKHNLLMETLYSPNDSSVLKCHMLKQSKMTKIIL